MTTGAKAYNQNGQEEEYYHELSLFTQCMSELMGTFIWVLIGCGAECAALYMDESSNGSGVQVPFLWVIGAALGIYSAASISSGHLNPAVTLAFALVRPSAFPWKKVIPYWIAQICGCLLAGLTNYLLFYQAIENYEESHLSNLSNKKNSKKLKAGECTEYERAYLKSASAFGNFWSLSGGVIDEYHACFIEAFGTAFVVFIIFIVTSPMYPIPGPAVPPIVAVAIGAMITILGPLTGAGLNPARDTGLRVAAFAAHWDREIMTDFLPYVVGPLIGGPIGGWCAELILNSS